MRAMEGAVTVFGLLEAGEYESTLGAMTREGKAPR